MFRILCDDVDRTPTEEDRLIEQRNWKDLVIPKKNIFTMRPFDIVIRNGKSMVFQKMKHKQIYKTVEKKDKTVIKSGIFYGFFLMKSSK